jgi:hypothetical protein
VEEIERSHELGVRMLKAQALGVQGREVQGCEVAKEQEDRDRPLKMTHVGD